MKRIAAWVPVFVWAGAIFALSSLSNDLFGFLGIKVVRKFGHMAEYFVLAFLTYTAVRKTFRWGEEGSAAVAGLVPFLYAISDELHQYFVVSRICDARDVFFDLAGVTCFFFVLDYYSSRKRARHRHRHGMPCGVSS